MDFIYFKGPLVDMADLMEGLNTCSICGQEHEYCFDISYALTSAFGDEEKEGKIGCYDCLKKGAFEFWHDTEYGMVDGEGIGKLYNHNMDNPPGIPIVALTELRRTPQIITWQQELWLTHCSDFMVYKGTWGPLDFYKNSPTGDGRDIFMEMTDKEIAFLWDDSLQEGKTFLEDWYPTYYVFECRHCGKLRGNWDCD